MAVTDNTTKSLFRRVEELKQQQIAADDQEASGSVVQETLIGKQDQSSYADMLSSVGSFTTDLNLMNAPIQQRVSLLKNQMDSDFYIRNFPRFDAEGNPLPRQMFFDLEDSIIPPASPNFAGLSSKIDQIFAGLSNSEQIIDSALELVGYKTSNTQNVDNKVICAKLALAFIHVAATAKASKKQRRHDISNQMNTEEITMDNAVYQAALVNSSSQDFTTETTPNQIRSFLLNLESAAESPLGDAELMMAPAFNGLNDDDSLALRDLVVTIMRSAPEYFELPKIVMSDIESYNASEAMWQVVKNNKSMSAGMTDFTRLTPAEVDIKSTTSASLIRKSINYFSSCKWNASKGSLNSILALLVNVMKGTPSFAQTGGDMSVFNGMSVIVSDHPFAGIFGMDRQNLFDKLNIQRPDDEPYIDELVFADLQARFTPEMNWVALAVDALNTEVAATINPLLDLLGQVNKQLYFEYDIIGKHMGIRNVTNTINLWKSPILCGLIADSAVKIVNPKMNSMREQNFKCAVVKNLKLMHPTMIEKTTAIGSMDYNVEDETDKKLLVNTFDLYFGENAAVAKQVKMLKLTPESKTELMDKRRNLYISALALSGLSLKPDGKIDVKAPRMTNFVIDPAIASSYIKESEQAGNDLKYNPNWVKPISAIAGSSALAVRREAEADIALALGLPDNASMAPLLINTLVNVGSYIIGTPFASDLVIKHGIQSRQLSNLKMVTDTTTQPVISNPELADTGFFLEDGNYTSYFLSQSIQYVKEMLDNLSRHSDQYKTYKQAQACLETLAAAGLENDTFDGLLISVGYGKSYTSKSDDLQTLLTDNVDLYADVRERLLVVCKMFTPEEVFESLSMIFPELLSYAQVPVKTTEDVLSGAISYAIDLKQNNSVATSLSHVMISAGIPFNKSNISIFGADAVVNNNLLQTRVLTSMFIDGLNAAVTTQIGNMINGQNKKIKRDQSVSLYPMYDTLYASFDNADIVMSMYRQIMNRLSKMAETKLYKTALTIREAAEHRAANQGSVDAGLVVAGLIAAALTDKNSSLSGDPLDVLSKAYKGNKPMIAAVGELRVLPKKIEMIKQAYETKHKNLSEQLSEYTDGSKTLLVNAERDMIRLRRDLKMCEEKYYRDIQSSRMSKSSLIVLFSAYEYVSRQQHTLKMMAKMLAQKSF